LALVTWDTSYSVSVKSCDAAHQKLFSLINQLYEAMRTGKGRAIIVDTVQELEAYTHTHFQAEEALMERARYPALKEHRLEHQKFVAQVKQFESDLEAGGAGDPVAVLGLLQVWLSKHIKQTDKKYSEALNSHGIN
jgi:hemerythrin